MKLATNPFLYVILALKIGLKKLYAVRLNRERVDEKVSKYLTYTMPFSIGRFLVNFSYVLLKIPKSYYMEQISQMA